MFLKKIQNYFIGNLINEEKDILKVANIIALYHIVLLSLVLITILQSIYFIIDSTHTQQISIIITFIIYLSTLFIFKLKPNVTILYHVLIFYSTSVFTINIVIYPDTNIINGLLLGANIIMTYNFLNKKIGRLYAYLHLFIILSFMCYNEYYPHNISNSIYPLTFIEKVFTVIILFLIFNYITTHFLTAHQNLAAKLNTSIADLQISEGLRNNIQTLAKSGDWEYDFITKKLVCDEQIYSIFEKKDSTELFNFLDFIHPEDKVRVDEETKKALITGNYNTDYRILLANNKIKHINSIGNIIFDTEKKPIKFYGISADITERKKLQEIQNNLLEEVSYQNVQLKNFTYIVSHNLRSHASNIKSLISFLDNSIDEREKIMSMLRISAEKLDETLLNLNEIINITENTQKPKELINLSIEVEKTLGALNGLILQHNIEVTSFIPTDITIKVIPSYCESIILNLISNAIKYRSPNRIGKIHISARKIPDYVLFEVTDNGLGLDLQRYGNKIFGMYKVFHENENARGLGLFLCKNQIETMKGKIEIESTEDLGTTFKVYFNEKY